MLYGFIAVGVLRGAGLSLQYKGASPVLVGAIVGLVGPLALRSQITTKKIAGKESPVGITYIYDVARINALYALDERMVRLRRRDVRQKRHKWLELGLDAEIVAREFIRHVDDHERIPEERRQALKDQAQAALEVRGDEGLRMDGMIKLLRRERFGALIDELDAYVAVVEVPSDVKSAKVPDSSPLASFR
jgi:hypothetical protein